MELDPRRRIARRLTRPVLRFLRWWAGPSIARRAGPVLTRLEPRIAPLVVRAEAGGIRAAALYDRAIDYGALGLRALGRGTRRVLGWFEPGH